MFVAGVFVCAGAVVPAASDAAREGGESVPAGARAGGARRRESVPVDARAGGAGRALRANGHHGR